MMFAYTYKNTESNKQRLIAWNKREWEQYGQRSVFGPAIKDPAKYIPYINQEFIGSVICTTLDDIQWHISRWTETDSYPTAIVEIDLLSHTIIRRIKELVD